MPAKTRQIEAFSYRGISLSSNAHSKFRFLEIDTSRSQLGLEMEDYEWPVQHGTHIVHNAASKHCRHQIGFQFISSIGAIGYAARTTRIRGSSSYDHCVADGLLTGEVDLRTNVGRSIASILVFSDPWLSRPCVNPIEHFAFMVKSAQSLRACPDLEGLLR
ncbi:Iterative polyketide synthase CazM [Cladobotryum mycophilum]|uniref:Iterative polyketide synthase CazM n=1 Tax=Cladobotryum mycophilum TaxID=491253 RepID=A0ABR0SIL9_9HYPO